jgi:predicted O-methyltransferase YrrM
MYREFYEKAIEKEWEVKYDLLFKEVVEDAYALSMVGNWNPISIKQREFNYIRNFIEAHDLRNGYELATGVGISCIAAGLAMKGKSKVVTVDAYIEENRPDSMAYIGEAKVTYKDAKGYKSANQLIKEYGLEDTVITRVGWSPDDVGTIIKEEFGDEKLQYVFIDGLHVEANVIADIEAVLPYLDEKFALFLHDTHSPHLTPNFHAFLGSKFGKTYTVCPGCEWHRHCGFNLSLVTNIE